MNEPSSERSHPERGHAGKLTPQQRAALETQFLQAAADRKGDGVRPRTSQGPVRLSSAQERFWFLDRLRPGSALYNVPWAYRLTGPLDAAAVQRSIDRIVERHEILRSTISESPEGPCQIVGPPHPLAIDGRDLSDLPAEEREEALHLTIQGLSSRPFDLRSEPMLRVALIRLGTEEHVLLFVLHHIASDGWSRAILTREFSQIYRAEIQGVPPPLPELPIQYADFAFWQRERLRSGRLSADLDYWRKNLQDLPPDLRLPSENAHADPSDTLGRQIPAQWPHALAERLRALARAESSTLFMVLLTGFMTLLSRYTDQTDLVVGAPIAGRIRPETEPLIGLFVNTLALRTDLSGRPTFREALHRVRQACLNAYEHQEAPFEEIVAQVPTARDAAALPLVRVMLALQNMPSILLTIDDVEVAPLRIDTETAKLDLMLVLYEGENELHGFWEFKSGLLTASFVERLERNLMCLLDAAVTDPDMGIDRLPLLDRRERQLVIEEWNRTDRPFPRESTIHGQFEAGAAQWPHAEALVCQSETLSYSELNKRANRLAHSLIDRGIGPNVCVGLCLDRSLDLVVAILAILKAGGAYVPLDPSYPRERLAFMLKDTGAPVLLTTRPLAEGLGGVEGTVLYLDEMTDALAERPASDPEVSVDSDDLAYVIYTSGSTGTPKGVAVPHRAVLRLVFGVTYARLDSEQTHLLLAPISFDASTFELWGALLHGARCVIYPEPIPTTYELGRVLRQERVSVLWLTSALFNLIIDQSPDILTGVSQLLTGGEALSLPHVRRALELLPDTQLINGYGPTEGTTFTCCYPIPRTLEETLASVPIGRPIANTRVYIVDEWDRPVPIGVPGELLIGGDGLAREYLHRPEMTADRFGPDPFSDRPDARIYRTGDRVRYLADGRIEFLGRNDAQVKLRGFRIELGEIEAASRLHPDIRDVAVVLREDHPGDRRLVAYVVAEGSTVPTTGELAEFLQHTLPGYMLPSLVVGIEALPLGPTGKIDRQSLPCPTGIRPQLQRPYAAPRDEIEDALARLWTELLHVNPVGIHDDFLELGGYSLLAAQLLSRVRTLYGLDLSPARFYEEPTIEALAGLVRSGASGDRLSPPAIRRIDRDEMMPVTGAVEQMVFLQQLAPESVAYTFQALLHFEGDLKVEALQAALNELVRRHEILRTTFHIEAGEAMQRIHPPWAVELLPIDLSDLPAGDRAGRTDELLAREIRRNFDSARLPLISWRLIKFGDREHLLLHREHHIIHDGWSFAVFLRELKALYGAFAEKGAVSLPEPRAQFADYAAWQRRWLQGQILERLMTYWKDSLEGELPILDLPLDRPRPRVQSFEGAEVVCDIPDDLASQIRELCRTRRCTLFSMLLAAYYVLLKAQAQQDDLIVGVGVANRRTEEAEALIGMLINTVPLRMDVSGDPSFIDFLDRVHARNLEASGYQDLPFDRMVERIAPARDLSRNPIFQTMFSFHDSQVPSLEWSDLLATVTYLHNGSAKCDLNVVVMPWAEQAIGVDRSTRTRRITMKWEYASDLFDETSIEAMTRQYLTILRRIVTDSRKPISQLLDSTLPLGREGVPKDELSGHPSVRSGTAERTAEWSGTETRLASLWSELLGLDTVGLHDNFFDLGGHSLLALRLFSEIERRFGRVLPIAELFQAPTVRELAAVLDRDQASASCLVPIQARGRKPPLFLIHAGGGHVLFYRDLARRMGKGRPIYGLEAVGTRGRTPHDRVEIMAAYYLEEIKRVQPEGPYRLGGSSFGGLVAFEMARLLAEQGERANLVALFDTHIGVSPRQKPLRHGLSPRSFRSRFMRVAGHLWRLPLRDKLFYARAKLDRGSLLVRRWWLRRMSPVLKRLPWGSEAGLSSQLVETRKEIQTAFRAYLPGKLSGTAVLFRASEQIPGFRDDPAMGWGDRVDELRVHSIPGFHGDIVSEPAVGGLIGPLREELERSDRDLA